MPDCIDCSVQAHHTVAPLLEPLVDLGLRQPLGALVVLMFALYALLAVAGRVADRVEPPRPEWRPDPIRVPARDRVWRFPNGPRGRI